MLSHRATFSGLEPPATTPLEGDGMTIAANIVVNSRLVDEVINGRQLEVIDEIVAADYVYIDPAYSDVVGPEALKTIISEVLGAFPDVRWTTEEQICQDDRVVSLYTWSGTQVNDFRYIPATGRRVTITGVAIDRFAHGQFVETRMLRDDLGFLRQLGVIPERDAMQAGLQHR